MGRAWENNFKNSNSTEIEAYTDFNTLILKQLLAQILRKLILYYCR